MKVIDGHVTIAPQSPLSLFTEMLEGQPVMVGLMLSITVTVEVHVDTCEFTSVTVNVTELLPTFEQPRADCETVIEPIEQLSKEPLLIEAGVIDAFPEALRLIVVF